MTASTTNPGSVRAERAAITRARIIHAAIQCLVSSGYTGTSTSAVCELAGVSRGAYQHHFATKSELVLAAVEELMSRMLRKVRPSTSAVAGDTSERVGDAIDAIWASFSSRDGMALLELWLAARTDPELAESMEPFLRRLEEDVIRTYDRLLGPELASSSVYLAVRTTTLSLLRGMVLERASNLDATGERHRISLELWKRTCSELLDAKPKKRTTR